jgi:hypothetical protein
MPPATFCLQYRERLLVSPAPIIRPTMGREWSLQHVELFPPRPADATEAMRDAFRCFLHVTLFGSDRMGRPVSHLVLHCKSVPEHQHVYVQHVLPHWSDKGRNTKLFEESCIWFFGRWCI